MLSLSLSQSAYLEASKYEMQAEIYFITLGNTFETVILE